jgi:hypothetical protein
MLIAKPIISKRFDPNTQDVEERRQLGQNRALTRADLERISEEADSARRPFRAEFD